LDSYTALAALAFLASVWFFKHYASRLGLNERQIMGFVVLGFLGAVVGGRGLYVVVNWFYFAPRPLEIIKVWRGGFVSYGGIIGMLGGAFFYAQKERVPLWSIMDLAALCSALAVGIGRFGCLAAGCDYGTTAVELPFAVTYSDPASAVPIELLGLPMHPVQAYMAFANLFVFGFLWFVLKRTNRSGVVFGLQAMFYASLRFWLEGYRGDLDRGMFFDGQFSTAQSMGIVWFSFGLGLVVYRWKRGRIG